MPSLSLQKWNTVRSPHLNEIENAHLSVGGRTRGRRYATQQINQAYAMLLSSQFQGFCRDLHSECVDHLARSVRPARLETVLRTEFIYGRKLDTGNPNPGNIGSDFNRLGLTFWAAVVTQDARNARRRAHLEKLNSWRNAIAHQDFDSSKLGGTTVLRLDTVRSWRQASNQLAISFDAVMQSHLLDVLGAPPW